MTRRRVLIAHAPDEEHLAERLAGPLDEAGYAVSHFGRTAVGSSLVGDVAKELQTDTPVVVCGTTRPWA